MVPVETYRKAVKVINSSESYAHLLSARRYLKNLYRLYEFPDASILRDFNWNYLSSREITLAGNREFLEACYRKRLSEINKKLWK